MSDHRRKPPQSSGGRAAARRGTPPPSSPASSRRRADRPHGGRAEARRAAQGTGRRRDTANTEGGGSGGTRPRRRIDYPCWPRPGWRRWVPSWRQVAGIAVTLAGTLVALVGIAYAMVTVPNENAAARSQKNTYYWADGSRMAVSGGGRYNREAVPLSSIPLPAQNAVISAENASFYTDPGIDFQGIARATLHMIEGGETQSGSTITQQFVKNTYLDPSQTITRKFKEMLISVKVGEEMSKRQILEGYLNTAYYGRGAYGIQAAAQAYYGVNAERLRPDQSAFLAALVNGPSLYDPAGGYGPYETPAQNLARAQARWSWILDREVWTGRMTRAERNSFRAFPTPQEPRPSEDLSGQIGYLVNLADDYIVNGTPLTRQQLDKGGYSIYTTFVKKDVDALRQAVQQVSRANFNPVLRPDTDSHVQVGGASVKPNDGAIVAIYGGSDYLRHFTDNADYTGAQVGSTFKPFVLAAALRDGVRDPRGPADQPDSERRQVSPGSVYPGPNDWKVLNYDGSVWHDAQGKEWLQPNDEDDSFRSITLKRAMELSVNSTYVQLGMDVGLDKVRRAALDAGIDASSFADTNVPSFSIGTSAPSAIRMANAYATFDANGVANDPYSVTMVVDTQTGMTSWKHRPHPRQAFSPAVAQNVTGVLEGVIKDGTGTYVKSLGRPAAGKTGTTDDNKSAWFTGYVPQLATSISLFRMDDQSRNPSFLSMYGLGGMRKVLGASYPAEIWTHYMKVALAGQSTRPLPNPPPIGQMVYGPGQSPSPNASAAPTRSAAPAPNASDTPAPSALPRPQPSLARVCGFFGCAGGPGTDNGGTSATGDDAGGWPGGPGGPGGSRTGGPTGGGGTGTDGSTTGSGDGADGVGGAAGLIGG